MNDKLLAKNRFYFAQCVFMNNVHYKAFNRLDKKQNTYHNIAAGISGITLVLIILHVIILENNLATLLNILSFCGLILTGASLIFAIYTKEDIGEIKNHHKNIAEEYKVLRDDYMSIIEEIMSNSDDERVIRQKCTGLQKRYGSLGKYAPPTEYVDYKNAQKGLGLSNVDEEFTWSNEEINRFLPPELRISENN